MSIITALSYQKRRNGHEVVVTLDNGATLALDADIAVQFRLAQGIELGEEKVAEISVANGNLLSRRKLIGWLAGRKKSELEARNYLKLAGFSPEAIDQAISHASNLGYLDDRDYAESFVRTRLKLSDKGPHVVQNELRKKGVDPSIAAEVVAPYMETSEQLTAARAAAEKKFGLLRRDPDLSKASQKMHAYLLRKGFGPDVAWQVTREHFGEPTQF